MRAVWSSEEMKKEVSRLIEGERDRRSPLKNLSLPPREKKNSLQNHSWLAITKFDASPALFGSWASTVGLKGVAAAWPSPFNREAWTFLAAFGSLQAALQLLLPGRRVAGPVTPRGNVPVYHANGVLSYFVTLALLGGAAAAGLWRPERVFDVFGEMLSSLNAFSLLLCLALWAKVGRDCFILLSFLFAGEGGRARREGEKEGEGKRMRGGGRKKLSTPAAVATSASKNLKKSSKKTPKPSLRATSPPPPRTRAPRAPSSTTTTGAWSSTLACSVRNSTSRRGQTAARACAAGRCSASASRGSSIP